MGLFFWIPHPINRSLLYYLVLLLAIPVLLRNTRLGFALIMIAIVLMYRNRRRGRGSSPAAASTTTSRVRA